MTCDSRSGAAAVLAGVLVLAGCSQAADKSGAETLVLKLASIDQVNGNGQAYGPQAFVDGLAAVSGAGCAPR